MLKAPCDSGPLTCVFGDNSTRQIDEDLMLLCAGQGHVTAYGLHQSDVCCSRFTHEGNDGMS